MGAMPPPLLVLQQVRRIKLWLVLLLVLLAAAGGCFHVTASVAVYRRSPQRCNCHQDEHDGTRCHVQKKRREVQTLPRRGFPLGIPMIMTISVALLLLSCYGFECNVQSKHMKM